ncbi:hypothetical protein IQE94_00130 [Synechocystis sp. PCC 7339]|uniref:hypothetical protein n=1 Tax=Synechocystis sp. PCC 7339 TaxID=2782213 RepID=UPI001CC19D6F|nr:hypothetical protein [Synechocystis sp. PCC 7339]UAJ72819.1 hypothetical protein IQE94_00130 [Synechocystis sp. PCC 7339]
MAIADYDSGDEEKTLLWLTINGLQKFFTDIQAIFFWVIGLINFSNHSLSLILFLAC